MAENKLNYDAAAVNTLLGIVDTNRGAFPLDDELSATSEKAVKNKTLYTEINALKSATVKNKGYFKTLGDLQLAHPVGDVGDLAYVGTASPYAIYQWGDNGWEDTGNTEGYHVQYMTYNANVTASASGTDTSLSVEVSVPNVPAFPKMMTLTAEMAVGTTKYKRVVPVHKTGDATLYGCTLMALTYECSVQAVSYTDTTLKLSVSCTFSSASASKSLNVGEISILY